MKHLNTHLLTWSLFFFCTSSLSAYSLPADSVRTTIRKSQTAVPARIKPVSTGQKPEAAQAGTAAKIRSSQIKVLKKTNFRTDSTRIRLQAAGKYTPAKATDQPRSTTPPTQKTAVRPVKRQTSWTICPNPAYETIRIEGWNDQEAQLLIYTDTGQTVLKIDTWNGEEINVSGLDTGYYNVRINNRKAGRFLKL